MNFELLVFRFISYSTRFFIQERVFQSFHVSSVKYM